MHVEIREEWVNQGKECRKRRAGDYNLHNPGRQKKL